MKRAIRPGAHSTEKRQSEPRKSIAFTIGAWEDLQQVGKGMTLVV